MDNEYYFFIIPICCMVLGLISIVIIAFMYGVYMPYNVEQANTYCKNLGYDQYKSYTDTFIPSKHIYGIKCEYISRLDLNIKEVKENE